VLSLLSVQQPLTPEQIAAHTAYTGIDIGHVALQALVARGLLQADAALPQALRLAPAGSDAILHALAAAKAVEAGLVERIGALEAASLRNLLKQAINATDPGLPKLWQAPVS
jgi:3-hydroxy-9,10-secoandrosta-1,3,5(10)-triene-9,17-dione monooxygenase reductase component